MRGFIALCIVAFCAGLGIIVGSRLSSEAVAVVVGVIAGVLAGIPTPLLLMIAGRQANRAPGPPQEVRQPPHYPPVIVVSGAAQLPPSRPSGDVADGQWWPAEEKPEFHVLGEETR